jgi:branched-subunit amino acid transport protein
VSPTLWLLVGVTALMTALVKAAGPVALGGRELPAWVGRIVALLAPALLAALVVTQVFAKDGHLAVGANAVGVACAGVVFLRGGSVLVGVLVGVLVAVLVAVLVTAGLRVVV